VIQVLTPVTAGDAFQSLKSERKWVTALVIVFTAGLLIAVGKGLILEKELHLRNQYMGVEISLERQLIFFVVLIPLTWGLKSVVFHAGSRILGGEKVEVSSTVHLMAYTYVPFIFKGIVYICRGLLYQPPVYEEFVYQLENPAILLSFIKEYNIFFLWAFSIMVIAVKEQYNLGTTRAFFAVFFRM
jgi:hypothetical protein